MHQKNAGGGGKKKKVAPVDAEARTKRFEHHDFSKGSKIGHYGHKHQQPKPKDSKFDHIADDLLAELKEEKKIKKQHAREHRHSA